METTAQLHGIFKAYLNGAHERGTGGVVYVKGEECAYRFPREFRGVPQFQEKLEDLLADDGDAHVYVIEERDSQLHVLAYPRSRVLDDALTSTHRADDAEGRIEEL